MEGKKFEIHPAKKFISYEENESVPEKLADVEPIESGNVVVSSREDLANVVELPVLEACQSFFDKGIETWMSSANKKDLAAGEVHIILKYDSLSAENKNIALSEGNQFSYLGGEYVKLSMPVTESSTVDEIRAHMLGVADRFIDQSRT